MAAKAKQHTPEPTKTVEPVAWSYTPRYATNVTYVFETDAPLAAGCKAVVQLFEQGRWITLSGGTIETKSFPHCTEFRFVTDPEGAAMGYVSALRFKTREGLQMNGTYDDGLMRLYRIVETKAIHLNFATRVQESDAIKSAIKKWGRK